MNSLFSFALLASLSFHSLAYAADPLSPEEARIQTAPAYRPGTLRHIVTFKFKPGVTQAMQNEVMKRFLKLKQDCLRNGRPYLLSVEAGRANSHEGADQGMTQGYIVSFRSEGDRNFYVGQPLISSEDTEQYDANHLAFKQFVGPLLAPDQGAFVFDFTVR